jgi:hypothetical protein
VTEEEAYNIALQELQGQNIVQGIWAKAMAFSEGDEKKAKANYLRFRAEQMMQEFSATQKIGPKIARKTWAATTSIFKAAMQVIVIMFLAAALNLMIQTFKFPWPLLALIRTIVCVLPIGLMLRIGGVSWRTVKIVSAGLFILLIFRQWYLASI